MAEQIELEVSPRQVMGKATKRLRKAGIIPANIYGHKQAPQAVQLEALAFERLRRSHGTRNIITLRLPGRARAQTALIRRVQRDPITGAVLHIDFFRVSLRERIHVKVPLRFVGESPGVKNEGGVLIHPLDTLEIACAASDIPDYLEVDISSLAEIDDALHARDIKLPANVTLLTDPDETVAKVTVTRAEIAEEAEEAAGEAEAAAPAAEAAGQPAEAGGGQ